MKSILAIFLISILLLIVPLSIVEAKLDKENPVTATDIQIGKKITIKGSNGHGKPSGSGQAATGILGATVTGKKYAIVIGISDYIGTANDLTYGDVDAKDIQNTLNNTYGFEPGNIKLLLNSQATYDNISAGIDEVKESATADDEVVFFYSGHGANGIAADGDKEVRDESIISFELSYIWDGQLKQWFSDFKTNRIIFIFDSCFSGGMNDLKEDGRIILAGSSETGYSYEGDQWGNGQFTYYLHEGIDHGYADKYDNLDGVQDVTVEEAFDYAKANSVYQKPMIFDSFPNDLLP
jgi:uncharacterized caspase-like protein